MRSNLLESDMHARVKNKLKSELNYEIRRTMFLGDNGDGAWIEMDWDGHFISCWKVAYPLG